MPYGENVLWGQDTPLCCGAMTVTSLGTELPGRVVRDALPVRGPDGPSAGGVLYPGAVRAAPGCHLPPHCFQTRGAAARGGETQCLYSYIDIGETLW